MEIDAMLFWNVILTMVLLPFGWIFNKTINELNRVQILLNQTRETYATKEDLRDQSTRIFETLHRLEDKLDNLISKHG
tara:strand:- start:2240 stop:2473 length:234 start_codon:yes stop_codon:yes gene_type:complete